MPTFQEWRDEVLELYAEADAFARGRDAPVDDLDAAAARLREGRFAVVVAGEFKQGKSSLLTALLEEPGLFPVDLDITTNLVTTAVWAPDERITVLLGEPGQETPKEIAREEIAAYVTEQRNPTRKRTDEARMLVIETPNSRLREGLVLVDTPGVGGVDVGHTDLTYAFIPNADAVVFTTDALAPLTTDELDFVRRIAEHTRLLLFAVTKIDAVSEWEVVVANDRAKLAVTLDRPADELTVIPVSSRLKLEHLRSGDPDELADSNFPVFESALWALIADQRGFVVVLRALHDLDGILAEVERPLQAEFQGYAQNVQSGAQKQARELEESMRRQEERVAALMDRSAPWRNTLRNGMQEIRESSGTVLGARLKDLRRRAVAYLDDSRRLKDPASIAQGLEADANSAIVLTGSALSRKAAALHGTLVDEMGLDFDPFKVAPFEVEGISLDLSGAAPVRTGKFETGVEVTKNATFSATAGGTLLTVVGGTLGGIVGFFLGGGVGAVPGIQAGSSLGAGVGTLFGAYTGGRRRLREIRERDAAATRRAVEPLVRAYLEDMEAGAREVLLNAQKALGNAVEAALDELLRREQRTLAATRKAFEKARAATREEAAREMNRLRAPLAELARLRARTRALAERIAAERDAAPGVSQAREAATLEPATA